MCRLKPGMIVRTSYGTGPYKILEVEETSCKCPSFIDAVTFCGDAPESKEHIHLLCRKVGDKYRFYRLNGYDEDLRSVWDDEYLLLCEEETMLLTIICGL